MTKLLGRFGQLIRRTELLQQNSWRENLVSWPEEAHSVSTLRSWLCRRHLADAPASRVMQQEQEDKRQAEVKRLIYRAKQRGFLELDLLIGSWAEKRVPTMGPAEFEAFQEVLEQENPDVFKWMTGQMPAPPQMHENTVFKELQEDVQKQLDRRRPADTAAQPGRNWVRGWDDAWREKSPESDPVPDTRASSRTQS